MTRISIKFSWIRVNVDLADPEIAETLKGDPLAIKIAQEIAQMAKTYLSRPSLGKKGIPGLSTLKSVMTKAEGLVFIDSRFQGLVRALQRVIKDVEGMDRSEQTTRLFQVHAAIKALTSPAEVLEIGTAEVFDEEIFLPGLDDAQLHEESLREEESQEDDDVVAPAPASIPVAAWAF